MRVNGFLLAMLVGGSQIVLVGCNACNTRPSNPDQVREKTAAATAELKDNAKAVAQGIREGLTRPSSEHPLDLNSASKIQLMSLPGIDESAADRIIDRAALLFGARAVGQAGHLARRVQQDRGKHYGKEVAISRQHLVVRCTARYETGLVSSVGGAAERSLARCLTFVTHRRVKHHRRGVLLSVSWLGRRLGGLIPRDYPLTAEFIVPAQPGSSPPRSRAEQRAGACDGRRRDARLSPDPTGLG